MSWKKQVEQWRLFAIWEGQGIPPDLVLAIVNHESAGIAGLAASIKCKPGPLPKYDGSTITANRALGLMQCIPDTIAGYNQANPAQIAYYEDMTGTSERAARLQIRVGGWAFNHAVSALHSYDAALFPATHAGNADNNHLTLALVAYAIGSGALKSKLDKLKEYNAPLNLASLRQHFPNWGMLDSGQWINRPLHYAQTVSTQWRKDADPNRPPHRPAGAEPRGPLPKLAAAVPTPVILIAALLAMKWYLSNRDSIWLSAET